MRFKTKKESERGKGQTREQIKEKKLKVESTVKKHRW